MSLRAVSPSPAPPGLGLNLVMEGKVPLAPPPRGGREAEMGLQGGPGWCQGSSSLGGTEVSVARGYQAGPAGIPGAAPGGVENFLRTESEAGASCLCFFSYSPEVGSEGEGPVMLWPGSAVSSEGFSCTSLTLLVSPRGYVC